ncbi:MAG: hypothetical protein RIR26_897 [Pseudomonadota bacterium]
MSVLIHAHGFALSDSLKEACMREVDHRLKPLLHAQLSAHWNLYREGHDWIAFLSWHERRHHQGNVRIRSDDLYKSISLAGKVAADQLSEQNHKYKLKVRRQAKQLPPSSMEGDVL